MTIGNETISTASADGIVSYSTDGYENFDLTSITPEEMDEKSYEVKRSEKLPKKLRQDKAYIRL